MKKLFMLLAALMFTGAMFAQNATCYPLPEGFPTSQNLDRDYWYGHTNSESYFVLNESDMFALRIPAGTIAAGTSIDKVRFYHSTSYTNSPEVQNTIYTIKIYSGNNGDNLPGTLAYTQVYTATADGDQEVALTTPYNVGTDEIWVAVEMTDNIGAVLLCGTPEGVEENTEYPMFYDGEWGFYRFGAQGSEEYLVKPFYLTLYINDNVGISENATSQVAVFPNPATNVLNVPTDGYKTIEIVNLLGQVVYSNNVTEATMQINVRDLNEGIYLVRLANENGVAAQKFIKK